MLINMSLNSISVLSCVMFGNLPFQSQFHLSSGNKIQYLPYAIIKQAHTYNMQKTVPIINVRYYSHFIVVKTKCSWFPQKNIEKI